MMPERNLLPEGEDNRETSSNPKSTLAALNESCISARLEYGAPVSMQSEQNRPTPEGWGWTSDEDSQPWVPVWNTISVASKACSELVKCGCKDVVLGVHAKRQAGGALNSAVVTAKKAIVTTCMVH